MRQPSRASWVAIISIIIVLVTLWAGLYFYWSNYQQDRAYSGVSIGSLDLSGTTKEQASNLIDARTENILNSGVIFKAGEKSVVMPLSVLSFESDLSFPALIFEKERMSELVFGGQGGQTFIKYIKFWLSGRNKNKITSLYQLDKASVKSWIKKNFPELELSASNAYFSLEKNEKSLTKHEEKNGIEINYDQVLSDLTKQLNNLENPLINLGTSAIEPEVSLQDLSGWEDLVKNDIINPKLKLSLSSQQNSNRTKQKDWLISTEKLITWLKINNKPGEPSLSLDQEKILSFLTETVAPIINREAILPRFEIKDGKVINWQAGQSGHNLNTTSSAQIIAQNFIEGKNESNLVIEEIIAENIISEDNLKIQEIIGTGHSRFAGSSSNRRHNIATGAAALHGLLIKPEEEFSLLKALGEIDAASGYLQELVIKGDKTIPEYGGGLCQIGTTVFRSALASGLPITERRNHSYRVSYYEPAGTDATIYDPAPDFRFLNDTNNYILIQSRIEGDDIYFDFWGTSDGRTASTTDPVIYNIVKPAPTKTIETDNLAPGEKKCTESAHSGADAYFDYTVIYPEGSTTTPIKTRRFSSHYVPWQAVCLIGKATSTPSSTEEESVATSTPEVVQPLDQ